MWKAIFFQSVNAVDCYQASNQDDLDQFTYQINEHIQSFQLVMTEHGNDNAVINDTHLVSFALAAYCDEKITLEAIEKGLQYSPLQLSLFNTTNAGDVFFDYVENILNSQTISDVVCWVYYYLLKRGYQGRYGGKNNYQRTVYLRQLLLRFSTKVEGYRKFILNNCTRPTRAWSLRKLPFSVFWAVPLCVFFIVYYIANTIPITTFC